MREAMEAYKEIKERERRGLCGYEETEWMRARGKKLSAVSV